MAVLLVLICLSWSSAAFAAAPGAYSVKGQVWYDLDGDDTIDPDEPFYGDVLLVLSDTQGQIVDWQRTDDQGRYALSAPAPGDYWITKSTTFGYTATSPTYVGVSLGTSDLPVDFSQTLVIPGCYQAVYGVVWHDLDADGQRAEGENGVGQVPVHLYTLNGDLAAVTLTDQDGGYAVDMFRGEPCYLIVEPTDALPANSTPLYWGVDLSVCHAAQANVGLYDPQALAYLPCASALTVPPDLPDTPSILTGSISVDDAPVGGVRLTLTDTAGQVVDEQQADSSGAFRFEGLAWQTYYLQQTPIQGYASQTSCSWGIAPTSDAHIRVVLPQCLSLEAGPHTDYLPHVARLKAR